MVNTSDNSVAVLALALSLVNSLKDNSLATSKATVSEDDNLSLFEARRESANRSISEEYADNAHVFQ